MQNTWLNAVYTHPMPWHYTRKPSHTSHPSTPSSTSPPTLRNQTPPFPTSDSPHYAPHTSTFLTPPSPPPAARSPSSASRPGSPRRIPSRGRFSRRGRGRSAFRAAGCGRRRGGSWRKCCEGESRCAGRGCRRRGGNLGGGLGWLRGVRERWRWKWMRWRLSSWRPSRRRRCMCDSFTKISVRSKAWDGESKLTVCHLYPRLRLWGPSWALHPLRRAARTGRHLVLAVSSWLGRRRICPWCHGRRACKTPVG